MIWHTLPKTLINIRKISGCATITMMWLAHPLLDSKKKISKRKTIKRLGMLQEDKKKMLLLTNHSKNTGKKAKYWNWPFNSEIMILDPNHFWCLEIKLGVILIWFGNKVRVKKKPMQNGEIFRQWENAFWGWGLRAPQTPKKIRGRRVGGQRLTIKKIWVERRKTKVINFKWPTLFW